jgi:hypothetical protein
VVTSGGYQLWFLVVGAIKVLVDDCEKLMLEN